MATKKYKLERKVNGEWCMYGMYTEPFLPQLIQAAMQLGQAGYKMYGSLRVVEINEDGENRIL